MSYINKPKLIIESTTSTDNIKTQTDVSHKSKIPSSTKRIPNKDACEEEKDLRNDLKTLNEGIKIKRSECAVIKYKIIYEYFDPDKRHATFKDLLNALMLYYKDINREKKQELHLESFLDMFEMDTMKRKNFKKQHVFEALCKILLMYDYDNGGLGKDKQFYRSLEAFIENPNSSIITRDQIIHTEINVSSEGGVVDIFFKTKHDTPTKSTSDWACDRKDDVNTPKKTIDGQEYILIQNKYFSKEKSDIKNYDVTRIRTKASDLYKEKIRPKIVLMVNNKQALSDKLTRSRDTNKGLIDAIYGVYEIDKWFNLLLYDLLNSSDIDDFLEKRGTKSITQPELAPRFHQMYFTDSTIEYRRKEGYKKFIWGAVPRSGKSYMIGDLISKRKAGPFNDIILILGAKTETESQFIEMFCKFSNYNDYGIIKTSAGKIVSTEGYVKISKNLNKLMDKNIYIFSQEWFKTKLDESAAPVFDLKHKTKDFEQLFKSGNVVDVYFDEVHKGGTTDKSENILNAINRAGVKIDIFVMVTATFAKPNIKYQTNFIDKKEPKIIEWSYEDQQIMKNIKNETKMDMMINSRVGIEREVIRNTFEYYKSIYHNEFLDIISKEYARHPELVLVQPFDKIEKFGDGKFEIDKIFKSNLNCEACYENQTKRELRDPSRIFFDYGRIQNLLRLIAGDHNPKNSVYGYLKSIGAPDYSKKHSELWFLPDDDLYITPDTCRENGKCKQLKSEKSSNENKNDNKQSLPNIEALTRGLALALMENEHFKKYYNVLIVHNTYVKFKNSGDVVSYEEIFKDTGISTTADSKNLSGTIKDTESNAFREGKNLIILTGAKLRLGISLPCVDIGFNFDNIQSVDVNYQTMFRVLTERYNQPKQFGYYVDFNKERFINFLYQYSNTYSSAKNVSNIKANLSTLQGLLYLFNINGIGLGKLNENQELKLYTSLIEELDLNEAGYKTYYSDFSTMTDLIKKSLINVRSSDLQKFKKLLDSGKKITKPPKLKITLAEGTKVDPAVVQNDSGNDDKEEIGVEEEPEVENDSNTVIVNIIADMLPRIIALIGLFSNEDNYNCDNLSDCLGNCLRKIQEFGTGCNCSIVSNSDVLSCYLNSPFYADKLGLLLETIDGLLNDSDNKQLHDSANFIFNNIREMGKENLPLIYSMSPEDIQAKIEKYLPVREEKKNKNGEVFTPIRLIEEMLQEIPANAWTNPELKWLDPANGIGNFPMVVYNKLLEQLPKTYKDLYSTEQGKKKHIIEKMLYMVELDTANVKISRRIFGKNANISCGSFLEDKWIKDFNGVEKFDIIVGNPPYNENGVGKGGGVLWKDFVFKSFSILNENGFLVFIHPTGWRKPSGERASAGDVWVEFKKNNLIFLKTSDKKIPNFPIVDYYVVQKTKKQKDTHIINEFDGHSFDGKLNLYNSDFIPHFVNEEVFSILNKVTNKAGDKFDIIYNQSFKPTKEDMGKSGVPHAYYYDPSSKDYLLVYKKYEKDTPEYINQNKIIMTYSNGKQKGFLYPKHYSEQMGTTRNTMYQLIKSGDSVKNILLLLNSDLINFILKITQYSEAPNYKNEFKILNMIAKPNGTAFKNDNDIYKYFGLNSKEVSLIQSLVASSSSTKEKAASKINNFVTKKLREKKGRTKKASKGGRRSTKKHGRHNRTRRA
jgi:hypothetical protein